MFVTLSQASVLLIHGCNIVDSIVVRKMQGQISQNEGGFFVFFLIILFYFITQKNHGFKVQLNLSKSLDA